MLICASCGEENPDRARSAPPLRQTRSNAPHRRRRRASGRQRCCRQL